MRLPHFGVKVYVQALVAKKLLTWDVITPDMFSLPSENWHLSFPLASSMLVTRRAMARSTIPESFTCWRVPGDSMFNIVKLLTEKWLRSVRKLHGATRWPLLFVKQCTLDFSQHKDISCLMFWCDIAFKRVGGEPARWGARDGLIASLAGLKLCDARKCAYASPCCAASPFAAHRPFFS